MIGFAQLMPTQSDVHPDLEALQFTVMLPGPQRCVLPLSTTFRAVTIWGTQGLLF
jgi:hypothetical protein